MYHVQLSGAHYDMGRRLGDSIAQNGQRILDGVPFPITQERRAFAHACLPIYQEFFPEILEEIKGLADSQRCALDALQTVLFSMYAIPPACQCSCFAVSNGEHILLGRNSDFIPGLEYLNANVMYKFSNDSCHFTGNTTAFVEIEDGVNAHGLAAGLTAVYPVSIRPGFNAGMLLRFFLEKCRTTEDVIRSIQRLPVGSAQTFTVADAAGNIAVIECTPEKSAVIRPSAERPFVCATNTFHAAEMLPLQDPGVENCRAEERYHTLVQALSRRGATAGLPEAEALLSGKYGFLCQYDRTAGTDTVWSVIYDLKGKAVYRVEGNPARNGFIKDEGFSTFYLPGAPGTV